MRLSELIRGVPKKGFETHPLIRLLSENEKWKLSILIGNPHKDKTMFNQFHHFLWNTPYNTWVIQSRQARAEFS